MDFSQRADCVSIGTSIRRIITDETRDDSVPRPEYQKPEIVDFDDVILKAIGRCHPGASDTTTCASGTTAAGVCGAGAGAMGGCGTGVAG